MSAHLVTMTLNNVNSLASNCKYCKQTLYIISELKSGYHVECYAETVQFNKNLPDPYGFNREDFLPKSQLQFILDLEKIIRDIKPELLHEGKIPIFTRSKINLAFQYFRATKPLQLIVIRKGSNLRWITFSNIKITYLPESIKKIRTLDTLYIENCNIKVLPKGIFDLNGLTNLKSLKITKSKLQSIPSSIGNLSKLLDLELEGNELETLPVSMLKLKILNSLIISGNFFTSYPEWLAKLKKIEFFNKRSYIWSFEEDIYSYEKFGIKEQRKR